MVWIETPSNPWLRIVDIEAVSALAHERGALVVVDNTFATPALQQPLALGADVVVHSTTKYLGGHSDVVGGFVATDDDELAERIGFLQNAAGAVPGPLDCYLVHRGAKTLAAAHGAPQRERRRRSPSCWPTTRRSPRCSTRACPSTPATTSPPARCRPSAGWSRSGSPAARRPPSRCAGAPSCSRWPRASARSRASSSTPAA